MTHKPYIFEIKEENNLIRIEADSLENIHCFDNHGLYLDYKKLPLDVRDKIFTKVENYFFHVDAGKGWGR